MSEVQKYLVFDQNHKNLGFLMVGMEVEIGDTIKKESRGITEFEGKVYMIEEHSDSEYDANLYIMPLAN